MEKRRWGINGRERGSSLKSPGFILRLIPTIPSKYNHVCVRRTDQSSTVVSLYQRSSFTLRTFPRQVHVRRSNVIPLGHRILGHLHMQVLGSRDLIVCLQGLLLHVQPHFFSSNWKRFVHFDSMFVGSHLH